MKIFLNVVGILAFLVGPISFFAAKNLADQVIGGMSLLLACTALGFAKLIELGETHLDRTGKQRALEKDYWRLMSSQVHATSPAAPTAPRWFVANGDDVSGPFTEEQIKVLKAKGVVTVASQMAAEGTQDWRPITVVLAG